MLSLLDLLRRIDAGTLTAEGALRLSRDAILAEDALIADRNAERERVNSRFDADARRLRELLGNPAVSQQRSRSPNG